MTQVKICCIQDQHELHLAVSSGASAIGLVGHMPSGPGPIPDERIRTLASMVPEGVSAFLLTSETTAQEIVAHHQRTLTDTLQIVDQVQPEIYPLLRHALPDVRLVQVVHVTGQESLEEALRAAAFVDALLLDSGNPTARVKTLGGTGNVHDWKISRAIVSQSGIPVYLAGGLNPMNVAQAIAQVEPYGVDVCSGLRAQGRLDAALVDAFMLAVDQA